VFPGPRLIGSWQAFEQLRSDHPDGQKYSDADIEKVADQIVNQAKDAYLTGAAEQCLKRFKHMVAKGIYALPLGPSDQVKEGLPNASLLADIYCHYGAELLQMEFEEFRKRAGR
jgi:hypothetical protein